MEFHFDVSGADELIGLWGRAPDIVEAELLAAITEADNLLQAEVQDTTPRGATHALAESIIGRESVGPSGVLGEVGTPMSYAIPVELGTKPHFPPIEPLEDWVRAKVSDVRTDRDVRSVAFLIARAISRRGTPAKMMFHRTFEAQQPAIQERFVQARERIVAQLGGGA